MTGAVRGVRDDAFMPFLPRSAYRELVSVLRATTTTHRRLRDNVVAILSLTLGIDLL